MTKSIKLVAIFMALLTGFASLPVAQGAWGADNYVKESAQKAIIKEYFDCINRADWDGWVSCAAPGVREDKLWLVSDESHHRDNIGILTVNHAEVISMEKVSNEYAAPYYNVFLANYKSQESYACYKIYMKTSVNEDNGYFQDGLSYRLMVLIEDGGEWFVGGICKCPDELLSDKTSLNLNPKFGTGFVDFTSEPATINVKDERGVIHSNVPFDEYIINVTCNEIGNLDFVADAFYANIIAVKMIGWWAKAGAFTSDDGYDIKYGIVTYLSTLKTTSANTQKVTNYVNDMDGIYMLSSGGKLFSTNYSQGSNNSSGGGSGILKQYGSNYLATNWGYNWKQILHHYYNNATYNYPNCGIIKIGHTGSHNWGSYSSSNSNSSTHWRICTRCEAKNSASHVPAGTYQSNDTVHWKVCSLCSRRLTQAHTWVQYPRYYKCSVCGRMQQVIPGTQSLSK